MQSKTRLEKREARKRDDTAVAGQSREVIDTGEALARTRRMY